MSVQPHPKWPGYWTVFYREAGRRSKLIRVHIEGTEEDAKAYERQVRGIHVSLARTTVNPSFKTISEDFQTWAATNRSENYCKSIGWSLKNLIPHFGIIPPSRITDPLIEQYKAKRKGTPRACNQELEMLQIIINWGADAKRNYCQKLPFKVEKLKVFRKLPEPPAPEEFDTLLAQVRDNFKQARATDEQKAHKVAMLEILYGTGIRWIECRHLRFENVRQSDGRIYLGRTKNNEARYTFMPPNALRLLLPRWQDEGYIFTNPRTNEPYKSIGKSLRAAAKKCHVKLRGTHTLRHALGTDALEATDGDIRGTQVALGHADIKTTTLYTKTATGRVKKILESVQKYRNKTVTLVDNFSDGGGI